MSSLNGLIDELVMGNGQWSMLDAMISAEAISEVMKIKSIFHRKKKREEVWEKIKAENFMLDVEIDI